ncbi:MAG: RHS domain-containing protein [Proteus vulgaris]|nr:RHS domain-containing protein [Proteus vulgaris]
MQFSYNALGQEFLRQSKAGFANSSHYTATGLLAHQRAGRGTESFLQSLHNNPLQPPISTDVHRGYQYDKAFNLVNIDDARWNRTQYRYNANDQIVETQYSNQFECQSEKFQYDNNLNITEHQFIPSDAQGAFLQLAQQQQKGRVTRRITAKGYQDYHYDINGRLTQKVVHQHGFRAKTWYYQWNTLNQLIACFNPEGKCWRYTYDAFGRRLSKSKVVDNRPISPPNSPFKNKRVQRVDYLWSGDQMVQETPIYADGTPAYDSQIQWLYQPNEITPTARYQRGKLHYVVTDHQGTPREIFSEKGIVSWAGRLNTWGQMAFWQSHDNYADNDPEYTECHFRFAGQYEDKESGLYYNRFRYYDKDTGQYISPDPIGLLGGFNPYGYVYCPTGWVDPFGLAGCPIREINGTKIYGKGQKDGTPGHDQFSEVIANKLAMSGQFKAIYLNRSYSFALGKRISARRPDVMAIDIHGKIHAIELASKTDMGTKLPLLTSRNHEVISKLPTKQQGKILILEHEYKHKDIKEILDKLILDILRNNN